MACERLYLGDGTVGIVCTRGAKRRDCESCGRPGATIRCDYPVKRIIGEHIADGKIVKEYRNATCDRWQCANCATEIAPNVHHCRAHAQMGPPKL